MVRGARTDYQGTLLETGRDKPTTVELFRLQAFQHERLVLVSRRRSVAKSTFMPSAHTIPPLTLHLFLDIPVTRPLPSNNSWKPENRVSKSKIKFPALASFNQPGFDRIGGAVKNNGSHQQVL